MSKIIVASLVLTVVAMSHAMDEEGLDVKHGAAQIAQERLQAEREARETQQAFEEKHAGSERAAREQEKELLRRQAENLSGPIDRLFEYAKNDNAARYRLTQIIAQANASDERAAQELMVLILLQSDPAIGNAGALIFLRGLVTSQDVHAAKKITKWQDYWNSHRMLKKIVSPLDNPNIFLGSWKRLMGGLSSEEQQRVSKTVALLLFEGTVEEATIAEVVKQLVEDLRLEKERFRAEMREIQSSSGEVFGGI